MGLCSAIRWLALALVVSACARPVVPQVIRPAAGDGQPRIVVVKSDTNRAFDAAIKGFASQTAGALSVYTLDPEADAEAVARAIRASSPGLVFTLGSRATLFARERLAPVPVLFAMVVNHGRLGLAGSPNVMGIALETPPAIEMAQFKMVLPGLRRVLAFYAPKESGHFVQKGREELAAMGIELVAAPVEDAEDVKEALATHGGAVDAVWLLNDPVVMNQEVFAFLREETLRLRRPFLASLSNRFAHAGALMAVSVDFTSLGAQAAVLARMLFEQGRTPAAIGVRPPIGATLTVNLGVAARIGLTVPPEVLPFINEVILEDRADSP